MKPTKRIYLFKSGKLFGPVDENKVEDMRKTGELTRYSWMMNEVDQSWVPIEDMPSENPFLASLKSLKERSLSGAFIFRGEVLSGEISGMHAFGIELLISPSGKSWTGLNPQSPVVMNLVDETHLKTTNAQMIFQNAVHTDSGTVLHFGWQDGPSHI